MIAFVVAANANVSLVKVYTGTSILMIAIVLTTVLIILSRKSCSGSRPPCGDSTHDITSCSQDYASACSSALASGDQPCQTPR